MKKLMTDAWRTAGARYNAARRLRRRAFFSTVSLALFSATTVGLAFVQILVPGPGDVQLSSYLSLLSGVLGAFILAISLIEWGARNSERAENLHRNAEALNGFSKRLRILLGLGSQQGEGSAPNVSTTVLSCDRQLQLQAEYDAIKATCFDNHEPIDDEMFLVQFIGSEDLHVNGKPRFGWIRCRWIELNYRVSSVWYFGVCWMVVAIAIQCAPWPARS